MKARHLLCTSLFLCAAVLMPLSAATPAFPGAEGYGANAAGGRGGGVYHVTNLNDSGPGSLRNGIQTATGARTIVFDVSGTIVLKSRLSINKPFLTLAGQTAPGDGITVAGWTVSVSDTHDVVIRYMRFRAGDLECPAMQGDSLTVDRSTDVILDHISASWSIDETLSVTNSHRVTVQWSIISESLNTACHEKGDHGYGSLLRYGSGGVTFHHNLFAHHRSRNPRVGDNIQLDFTNNIVYNAGAEVGYSGEASEGTPRLNYEANYFIAGPSTSSSRRSRAFSGGSVNTLIHQAGNLVDANVNRSRDGTDTGWAMFVGTYTKQETRFESPRVRADDATTAYRRVLASAGASLVRDPVDARVLEDVTKESGKIVGSQSDVGGWPDLRSAPAPADTDGDGIPDGWESSRGLNPRDPADGAQAPSGGYTQLEIYLESLLAPPAPKPASLVLRDDFADGDSQNQDLANHSVQIFNGRANNARTDRAGAVTFDLTGAGTSSEAFWAFFTAAGSPLVLGVGDRLSVSLTFSLEGFGGTGQDIRWGVLDSKGTRNTTNLTGGQNDASFIQDTGYGLQFYASGTGSPFVIGRRSLLTGANPFNSFGDFTALAATGATTRQKLADSTPYTLTYTIERLSGSSTKIVAAVTGAGLNDLSSTAVESSPAPNTTFDYFTFRIPGSSFAQKITLTELLVDYLPAAPVITSHPQPSRLTVQVGATVKMSVGASGSGLVYEWRKDGVAMPANESAATPTLTLIDVGLKDAGGYSAVVTNAGGMAVSDPVALSVSLTPVPPPPTITSHPQPATAVVGDSTALTVQATGGDLYYQWFKNGVLLPGATSAVLSLTNLQLADAGLYSVTVANSSGSVASVPASVLVVSAMQVTSVWPWPGYRGLCSDATLSLQFSQPPLLGKAGRITVFDSSGAVVDAIDMAANPQVRTIAGRPFNYQPVLVEGNSTFILLHQPLPDAGTYYVAIDPGVFTDASGAPYSGFSDPSLWRFSTRAARPASPAPFVSVAADDSADFCSVQGAIDFAPSNATQPFVIWVNPGVYREINFVPANKPFLTVRGVDREGSVLRYPNNNNLNPSTATRAMFGVEAADFVLDNITLHNSTPQGGSQAEAFRFAGQRAVLQRVTLKSFQDTLLMNGAGLVRDSLIEGDVDFLWGSGPVFFQNTELVALRSGGYYTQVRNSAGQNGFVFLNCRLTAPSGVNGVYLSRIDPLAFPNSQVIFLNSAMGAHIHPAGWQLNNATTAPGIQFFEHRSTDLSGSPLDTSQRLAVSRQLTAQEAARWSDPAAVLGGWVLLVL